jgi:hypothetical protein
MYLKTFERNFQGEFLKVFITAKNSAKAGLHVWYYTEV